MLDSSLKEQLKSIFAGLENNYTLAVTASPQHDSREELMDLLRGVEACSTMLSCEESAGEGLSFTLLKNGEPTGISFRGIPTGHEFTSLLLALLNLDKKGKNIPDEHIQSRVKSLKGLKCDTRSLGSYKILMGTFLTKTPFQAVRTITSISNSNFRVYNLLGKKWSG